MDYIDAQDAALAGYLTFKKWQENWLRQWLDPLIVMLQSYQDEQTLTQWETMPPELKQKAAEMYPDEYKQVEQVFNDLRKSLK